MRGKRKMKKTELEMKSVNATETALPLLLSVKEAALYSGLGINKIREITDDTSCKFVLWNGNKRMIKRKEFENWIDQKAYI